jgi:hypothetical protein
MGCKSSTEFIAKEKQIAEKIKEKINEKVSENIDSLFTMDLRKIPVNTSISAFPKLKSQFEIKERELSEMKISHASAMNELEKKLLELDSVTVKKVTTGHDNSKTQES